jgi:hypothetical protein
MKGQEIIDFLIKTNMQDKDVYVNFAYNSNGAYVAKIKHIGWDGDTTYIDIGKVDYLIKNDIPNFTINFKRKNENYLY